MEMMYQENHHHHLGTSPKIITSSASSSPSHEFSFSISLNPNSTYHPKESFEPNITKSLSSSYLDLSPADDIFFHGQLLPLHHLSHLPSSISPRFSTTSLEIIDDDFFQEQNTPNQNQNRNQNLNQTEQNNNLQHQQETTPKPNIKHKSFHFFGLRKWRKGCEETKDERQHGTSKGKLKLDALKRCVRMVKPFLSFRISSRRERNEFRRKTHSFPGIKKDNRGMGAMGYSSAPASIWTSPTNSGHLSASTATIYSSSPSDSTMEELQTAIQAAIAHCKNSIAMEDDKNKGLNLE